MNAAASLLIVDLDQNDDARVAEFLRELSQLDDAEALDDPSESAYIDAALAFDEEEETTAAREEFEQRYEALYYEERVARELDRIRVMEEARRRLRAEQSPRTPIIALSFRELLEAPTVQWWAEEVLGKSNVAVLAGAGGIGKSAVAVDLAACLATGTPFLGRFHTERARVAYVAGEGLSGYGPRFRAVAMEHGLDIADDRLSVVTSGVRLDDETSMERLAEHVQREGIDVLVLDTLSALARLESENDAAEAARVMRNIRAVVEARPGTSALLLAHVSKGTGQLRGSTVWRDNADAVLIAKGDSKAFSLSTKAEHGGKVKDGGETHLRGLSLWPAHGSVVVRVASTPEREVGSADVDVLAAMDLAPTSINGVRRATGWGVQRATRAFRALEGRLGQVV